MAVRNFNDAEKQKLIQIISQGSQVLGEVEDLKGGLKDTVKAIAEELELKPALINKAISSSSLSVMDLQLLESRRNFQAHVLSATNLELNWRAMSHLSTSLFTPENMRLSANEFKRRSQVGFL